MVHKKESGVFGHSHAKNNIKKILTCILYPRQKLTPNGSVLNVKHKNANLYLEM